jgi:dsDNA-binding SOS-regulon protein
MAKQFFVLKEKATGRYITEINVSRRGTRNKVAMTFTTNARKRVYMDKLKFISTLEKIIARGPEKMADIDYETYDELPVAASKVAIANFLKNGKLTAFKDRAYENYYVDDDDEDDDDDYYEYGCRIKRAIRWKYNPPKQYTIKNTKTGKYITSFTYKPNSKIQKFKFNECDKPYHMNNSYIEDLVFGLDATGMPNILETLKFETTGYKKTKNDTDITTLLEEVKVNAIIKALKKKR